MFNYSKVAQILASDTIRETVEYRTFQHVFLKPHSEQRQQNGRMLNDRHTVKLLLNILAGSKMECEL